MTKASILFGHATFIGQLVNLVPDGKGCCAKPYQCPTVRYSAGTHCVGECDD